jgi:ATP-dependent DNA helicase RecG
MDMIDVMQFKYKILSFSCPILKSLKDNGSPSPKFNTDEDRSFFEVELFIHEIFAEKVPLKFNPETIQWNLESIDRLLNLLVESVLGGIAEGIAENHTYWLQITDNHIIKILASLESNQVSIIAGGIAGGIAKKMITVLEIAEISKSRKDLLLGLSLVNNANNFENYIQSLVELNWITMTIPDKPTSPNQKYITTLKGRLVLEILRHNKK